ncbi:hypothetical protein TNCV_1556951 [Trichonephila clavipes]|nr:hypothetical protein TNCV_1556951 [Trichonephila clavipes]
MEFYQDCIEGVVKSLLYSAAKHPVRNEQYVVGHCHGVIGSHIGAIEVSFSLASLSLFAGHSRNGDRFNSSEVIYSPFGLEIHQNDHQARRRFVERAQNKIVVVPDFHKRILFSDEAHFWLNGYVNKQNCRICTEANPQVYVETPLHPEKLTV